MPIEPTLRPLYSAPCASAASSITAMPRGAGHRQHRIHVGRTAVKMDDFDRLGPRRDTFLDESWVDVPASGFRIDKDRCGPGIGDRVHRCHIRKRRNDDLVARTHAQCREREMQRDRAVAGADSVCAATEPGELGLEAFDEGTLRRNPGRFDGFGRVALLDFADKGFVYGNHKTPTGPDWGGAAPVGDRRTRFRVRLKPAPISQVSDDEGNAGRGERI